MFFAPLLQVGRSVLTEKRLYLMEFQVYAISFGFLFRRDHKRPHNGVGKFMWRSNLAYGAIVDQKQESDQPVAKKVQDNIFIFCALLSLFFPFDLFLNDTRSILFLCRVMLSVCDLFQILDFGFILNYALDSPPS